MEMICSVGRPGYWKLYSTCNWTDRSVVESAGHLFSRLSRVADTFSRNSFGNWKNMLHDELVIDYSYTVTLFEGCNYFRVNIGKLDRKGN